MEETNQIYTSIEASEILIKDNFKQQSQEEPEELHEALTSQLFDIDSGSSHLKRELL